MLYVLVIFLLYVIFIMLRYEGIKSISESYYRLGRYGYVFCIWLSLVSLLVMYLNMEKPLILIAGGVLFYVPVAAAYKEEIGRTVHYVGAVGAISLGFAWMLLSGYYQAALAHGYLMMISYVFSRRPILWIEIISFVIIGLCLL